MRDVLHEEIRGFVERFQARPEVATSWREPLVGVVDAADPGFAQLRALLGPRHAMPQDLMPDARSAVAVFLPYSRDLARDNRDGEWASRAWCVAFVETRQILAELGEHLAGWLARRDHTLTAIPDSHAFDATRLAADWSHKHVAGLAGLGRPGRHSMMITRRGCFGRAWSYLTDVPFDSEPRPTHEPCLHLAGQDCSRCVERCVGVALLADRLDPRACWARCLENEGRHAGLEVTDVCGKCMAGVPCSHVDPVSRQA
jgi:epoxyqueuosine reductase QueG